MVCPFLYFDPYIFRQQRERQSKNENLNGSEHSLKLMCLQFLHECAFDMSLFFKTI
jgi:hypothetical protein